MPSISVNLDHDIHVRVKKYADGIGVPLEKLCERAIKYALSSRYPDNTLPGGGGRPDNELPGEQPEVDNELPRPPFEGHVDNELPEGEIPPEIDNSLPGYGRPDQGLPENPEAGQDLPGRNPNPNPDVDVDLSAGGPRPTPYKK
jgi:hypothetical protein